MANAIKRLALLALFLPLLFPLSAFGPIGGNGNGGGGGGAVSSVSNSDGTLTVSPTTGDVVASLNLGHANIFTAGQTMFGTSWPSFAAGDFIINGLAGTPTFAANGEGAFWVDSVDGASWMGEGSSFDNVMRNSAGSIVFENVHNTQDIQFLGTIKNVNNSLQINATGIVNPSTANNAAISVPNNGSLITRNVADANAALTVSQLNASSTGDILDLTNSGGTVAKVTQAGAGSFAGMTVSTITGSTQCLHVNTSGVVSGTGTDCSTGGGSITVTDGTTSVTGTTTETFSGAVVSGTTPNATVTVSLANLSDVKNGGTATNGQVVTWNTSDSKYEPTSLTTALLAAIPTAYFYIGQPSGVLWNPSDENTHVTLSNGNATATATSSSFAGAVRATASQSSGQFYFELQNVNLGSGGSFDRIGLADATWSLTSSLGNDTHSIAYLAASGGEIFINSAAVLTGVGAYSKGMTLRVAVDLTGKNLWVAVNGGNWNGNATYSPGGLGGISLATLSSMTLFPAFNGIESTGADQATIATTAGQMQYALPTGYSAWSSGTAASPGTFPLTGDCSANNTGVLTCSSFNGGTAFGTAAGDNTGTSGATIPLLNGVNTWGAAQTFSTNDLLFANSGGGKTTLAGASSASNFTATFPAATDTVVELTQTQTLTNKTISGASNTLSAIALTSLATEAANTVVGNGTASTASPTALTMPSCSTGTSALTWTSGTGFGCNSISAGGLTVGTTTITSGTSGRLEYNNAGVLGELILGNNLAISSSTLNLTAPDNTKTTNYTIAAGDMGGQVNFNGSFLIVTFPAISSTVLAAGMSVTVMNYNASALTISTTPTINGYQATTIPQYGWISCTSNGTSLDCLGGTGQTFGNAAGQNTGTSGANIPLLNGGNTWSGTQTFGSVVGSVNAQSGTTYTLAASDCGKTVVITNAGAITLTTLNSLPVGCSIAVEQGGAGQITVSAGAGTTQHSAHSYTKTFGQYAIIGLFVDTNVGGSAADFIITGDGA